MRQTDVSIRALAVPQTGQKIYSCDSVPGFGIRVSHGGTRTFVLMHGRSRQLTTIGRVGVISLSEARAEARRILAEHTLGKTHTLSHVSFEQAVTKFLETHQAKESTKEAYRYHYNRHFLPKLRHEPIDRLHTDDFMRIIDKLKDRPAEASHAYAAASVLLNWAHGRRMIERSPLEGVKKPSQGPSRERVLTDDEIRAVFKVEDPPTIGIILKLILLTGQRPGQIAALRGEWRTGDIITFPASVMKGAKTHQVVISGMAAAILDGMPSNGLLFPTRTGGPFTNWSNAKRIFDSVIGFSDYTCHDCRRTFATKAAEWGVADPIIIEKVLAHNRILAGVAGTYNRFNYLEPMRRALQAYEAKLQALLDIEERVNGRDIRDIYRVRARTTQHRARGDLHPAARTRG